MPRYELSVVLKAMQRPETAAVLRRTLETLMERGAVIRDLENLGHRRLPYMISKHDQRHTHASYFLIDFHAAPSILTPLQNQLERDVDVVRQTVLKKETESKKAPCCVSSPSSSSSTPSSTSQTNKMTSA